MPRKAWVAIGVEFVVFGALIFGGAGTLAWPQAWVMLGVFFLCSGTITATIARTDPALLEERMKPPLQKGQPIWDRVTIAFVGSAFLGWLCLMGLDAKRFGWSEMPLWLNFAGAAGILLAYGLIYSVFRENTYLAPVVRFQAERGHRVVSSGPYAYVRHPMYAGAVGLIFSMALLLGSWAGVAGALVLAAGFALRGVLEERMLMRALDGYSDYAARVRYRLIPGIW